MLISFKEYERLTEMEDRYWGEQALKALEEGFLTRKETNKCVKREDAC